MAAANSETWESNSHKFIDSLDRANLGRFATDVKALRYIHKAEYSYLKLGGMRFQYMALS